jgi:hypothetical protein
MITRLVIVDMLLLCNCYITGPYCILACLQNYLLQLCSSVALRRDKLVRTYGKSAYAVHHLSTARLA